MTTQPQMLELVADPEWATLSAEGGDGVKFDQLVTFTGEALKAAWRARSCETASRTC